MTTRPSRHPLTAALFLLTAFTSFLCPIRAHPLLRNRSAKIKHAALPQLPSAHAPIAAPGVNVPIAAPREHDPIATPGAHVSACRERSWRALPPPSRYRVKSLAQNRLVDITETVSDFSALPSARSLRISCPRSARSIYIAPARMSPSLNPGAQALIVAPGRACSHHCAHAPGLLFRRQPLRTRHRSGSPSTLAIAPAAPSTLAIAPAFFLPKNFPLRVRVVPCPAAASPRSLAEWRGGSFFPSHTKRRQLSRRAIVHRIVRRS